MEALNRLVTESLARHGFDRPVDYRRLRWSQWVRCESPRSLLFVPSKPGVFAIAEEIMTFGSSSDKAGVAISQGTSNVHVGTAAPGCPAEQGSAAVSATISIVDGHNRNHHHDPEGHDFSFKPALSERSESKGAVKPLDSAASAAEAPRRMLAVLQFQEADDMAFVLDRMFSRDNPMRARLASGRCFVRFVAIEDEVQRRSIANSLTQWLAASAEKVSGEATEKPSGIGAHFAASLDLASTIGRAGADDSIADADSTLRPRSLVRSAPEPDFDQADRASRGVPY